MPAYRTAIGRWLAVGGAAHRPPRRARKLGHRQIVAPLAASVATTLAIGAGVLAARSAATQLADRRRRRDRRLGMRPGESVGAALQRMALAQTDLAIAQLSVENGDVPAEHAVHETRKAIKRLRAMLRAMEGQLEARELEREHALLRDTARRLSGARDAEVTLATLDGLLKRHARELKGRRDVRALREDLDERRTRASRQTVGDPALRIAALGELHAFRRRAAAWRLPERAGFELVEEGLERVHRQGRRRFARAGRAGAKRRTRAMHEWRKRVKDLRHAVEMLERPDLLGQRRLAAIAGDGAGARRHRRAAAEAAWLRRLAARAEKLGELLGEEHDLAVLALWIERQGATKLRPKTRRRLTKLIAARRRKLRRRALREGERIYGRSPRRFAARVGRAVRTCERA